MFFINQHFLPVLLIGAIVAGSEASACNQDLFGGNYKPGHFYEGFEGEGKNEPILSIGLLKHPLEDLAVQEDMESPLGLDDEVMEPNDQDRPSMIIKKELARGAIDPVDDIRIMRRSVNPLRIMKRCNYDNIRIMKKNPSVGTLRIMKRAANLGAIRIMKKNPVEN